ncbi:MAG: histidine kinase [Deltaproteobacteria bacterium]|nr:histidine kinase [Deltaproteobacteria bacterium]
MSPEQLESLHAYVGFGPEGAAALRALHPHVAPHGAAIIDDFYDAIRTHPGASGVIRGGPEQVARLKGTLRKWLDEVLLGPHDAAYLESHARIGRVHVRIELPQELMFTAMNRIRSQLHRVVESAALGSDTSRAHARCAVDQVLDLELAIMLDTYREALTDKLRARERLATIGELSATLAHELRNPLGTVESSLYLIQRRVEKLGLDDDVLGRHHERIGNQVRECATIITNLLELARERPIARQRVDVRALAVDALEAARLPAGVQGTVAVDPALTVEGDEAQLRQVLVNLLRNAAEALPGGGNIRVLAEHQPPWVHLEVSDDGPGIAPEIRQRIFELLFTTKAAGTGLGLALARRICEAHGGTLSLESSTAGARLRVSLPAGR